jgi:hypothetical protein
MSASYSESLEREYEELRAHGLSHEAALEACASGEPYRCWCGSEQPCPGGAQRYVGCPIHFVSGGTEYVHARNRGDVA